MRKFRCHKVVEAAEIVNYKTGTGPHVIVTVKDPGGAMEDIEAKADIFARGFPTAGDFLVRYDDGYLSCSPRKAFLDGYSPIDDSGADYQPESVQP